MLNIVIPMAGQGRRFAEEGYTLPKPLIPVRGRPMIEVVIDNLTPSEEHRFIFICQKSHLDEFDLERILKAKNPYNEVIGIKGVTEGAACTVLTAEKYISSHEPLMIANCDQYISAGVDSYLAQAKNQKYDGFIMTMKANHPKWSYLKFDDRKNIIQVVEKKVVSDEATVGIYNYRQGIDFVENAKEMILKNDRVNNEFYVAPVYNYMIQKEMQIGYLNIGSDRQGMYGLGVPEDLKYFNGLAGFPE